MGGKIQFGIRRPAAHEPAAPPAAAVATNPAPGSFAHLEQSVMRAATTLDALRATPNIGQGLGVGAARDAAAAAIDSAVAALAARLPADGQVLLRTIVKVAGLTQTTVYGDASNLLFRNSAATQLHARQ